MRSAPLGARGPEFGRLRRQVCIRNASLAPTGVAGEMGQEVPSRVCPRRSPAGVVLRAGAGGGLPSNADGRQRGSAGRWFRMCAGAGWPSRDAGWVCVASSCASVTVTSLSAATSPWTARRLEGLALEVGEVGAAAQPRPTAAGQVMVCSIRRAGGGSTGVVRRPQAFISRSEFVRL